MKSFVVKKELSVYGSDFFLFRLVHIVTIATIQINRWIYVYIYIYIRFFVLISRLRECQPLMMEFEICYVCMCVLEQCEAMNSQHHHRHYHRHPLLTTLHSLVQNQMMKVPSEKKRNFEEERKKGKFHSDWITIYVKGK